VWWQIIKRIFTTRDLRKKILIITGLLVVFRVFAHIPIPGVNQENLQSLFSQNQFFGLLDVFSGGGLSNFSIVMLGVGPYITASIIFQLLSRIVPQLERLSKEEGEEGRRKINQYTRWATVPLAFIQGYGTITLFSRAGTQSIIEQTPFQFVTALVAVAAGTIFLMWLGEIITEQGIGNGISMIIFAGIIAGLPQVLRQAALTTDQSNVLNFVMFGALGIAVIAGVVFMTEGQRNIPVSYARRVRAGSAVGGTTTSLPLRINQAGVMPIIFALSIMLFPGVVTNFLSQVSNETIARGALRVNELFTNDTFYGIMYFILVILFTFFYTSFTFDPEQIARNLQRGGGFIPGIRPGQQTVEYLKKVLYRITVVGALFLGLIAVLPFITQAISNSSSLVIGGTGLLIVVSVILESLKQIQAQLIMRDYDKYEY
jgi:preprotein translocase subunit SecY